MRPSRVAAALLCVAALALGACSSAGSGGAAATPPASQAGRPSRSDPALAAGPAWTQYHGDARHDGYAAGMPAAGTPKLIGDLKLDGGVLAQPIVVHGRIVAATENDTVYAFDPALKQAWKAHLGTPSPGQQRQCGDIDPLGITGTPIWDAATDEIFVVAELGGAGGAVRHQLVALDGSTGAVRWRRSVDLPGVSARDMQQRGALTITHGRVWVSYGAQAGDCGDYKGRVVGVPTSGSGAAVVYTAPTGRGGGIWNPAGPTVGPGGDLFVVSANGAAFPGDPYDDTNSVLRLDAGATRVQSFAPSDWAVDNRDDVGLGSQGVALVGSKWAFVGGKSGPLYVLRQNALGGIGGQVGTADICKSYGGTAVVASTVYVPCLDGVRAVRIGDAGRMSVLWHADSTTVASPIVGGGRVWAMAPYAGVLHGLDPRTGKSLAAVRIGATNRFATPAVDGSRLLIGTLTGLAVVRTS